MSESQSWFRQQLWKVCLGVILAVLLLTRIGYGQTQLTHQSAILQGFIHIQPVKAVPNDQTGKIQPGTPVKVIVTVENKGQQVSSEGQLYVRYAFAHPLDQETPSGISSAPIFNPVNILQDAINHFKNLATLHREMETISNQIGLISCQESSDQNSAAIIMQHQLQILKKEYEGIKSFEPQSKAFSDIGDNEKMLLGKLGVLIKKFSKDIQSLIDNNKIDVEHNAISINDLVKDFSSSCPKLTLGLQKLKDLSNETFFFHQMLSAKLECVPRKLKQDFINECEQELEVYNQKRSAIEKLVEEDLFTQLISSSKEQKKDISTLRKTIEEALKNFKNSQN